MDMPLNDDEFLRAHWALYFTYSRNTGDDYIKFLLKTKFTPRNVFEDTVKISQEETEIEDENTAEKNQIKGAHGYAK